MRLKITGGTLEASITEGGIIDKIQTQLDEIQEDKDAGFEDIQSQINALEKKQKEDRLKFGDEITSEGEERDKKIKALKEEILAFPIDEADKIRGEAEASKSNIELQLERITARLDKLTRSKAERTKRMRSDFSKDDIEIVKLKKEFVKVKASRKLPKPVKGKEKEDGTKFMPKLVDKSKLPI